MDRPTSRSVLVIIAVLLSIGGMALSAVLLQHHVAARVGGDPVLGRVCAPAASFSCDEVIASRWGRLEWGQGDRKITVPVAWIGFAFFAVLAPWFMLVGVPAEKHRWLHAVPTLLAVAGLIGSAFFEYIMFFVLEKVCPLCIATHVLILAILVIALLLWRRNPVPSQEEMVTVQIDAPAGRLVLAALLLAATTSALGWFIYSWRLEDAYAGEYFARWQDYDQDTRLNYDRFLGQVPVDIPISPEDPVRGPADAKHTLVVFSDLLCPACQALEITVLEQRRKEFPGRFRIVFKHFPLDKTCNPEIKTTLHPGACAAAVAAEAVRLLKGNDAFWQMHDAVFHNKGRFTTDFAYEQAEKLGIDRETYKKRIMTYSAWDHIKANVAEGKAAGVESTPVMFFDGRPLRPWGDRHLWKYLLSEETLQHTADTQPAAAETRPLSAPADGEGDIPN